MIKPNLQSCFKLIDKGYSIIPLKENKMPLIKWKQYQTKAMSNDEFENFYKLDNALDVALVCGYNDLEVIDIDTKVLLSAQEKKDFWNDFKQLLIDNIEGFEKKFIIVKTRSGGYHIIYKTNVKDGNKKVATLNGYTEALIESRGVGGYVVMYDEFVQGKSYSDIQYISDFDREILWSCAKTFNHIEEKTIQYEEVKKYNPETNTTLTPWQDFNSKHSVYDLINHEFDIVKKTSDRLIIRRHGATSAHSGYIYNSNLLYLFSTGTQYPHETALSPFAIYAIQKYNGDIKECAKALYKDGYGARYTKEIKKKKLKTKEKIEITTDEFPLNVFPMNIQSYIMEVHKTLNASIDFLGCAFLWVLSLSIGNAIKIEIKKGWVEPAVMWIAIVGRAGIGKTHTIESMVKPLKKINENEIELYNRQLEKYKEYQMLDPKQKKTAEEVQEPKKNQFIVGDITMEAFIDYHASNKNGIGILRDELSGWIKDLNKYREGSDLENYLSCWSGQMLNLTRKTSRSGYVPNAFVPIIGGVQPSILGLHFTPENKENGFIDRWLLCYPELVVDTFNDKEMDEDNINWYNEFIRGFYEEIRQKNLKYDESGNVVPFNLRMDNEAYKEYQRIFNKITAMQNSDEENEFMKSILPKQKSYIARFSLLLYVLSKYNKSEPYFKIDKQSVMKAEKLSDYFIKMANKNKVESLENSSIKEIIRDSKKRTSREKFEFLFTEDPELNRSKIAEELNVSRSTVQRWVNEIEKTGVA